LSKIQVVVKKISEEGKYVVARRMEDAIPKRRKKRKLSAGDEYWYHADKHVAYVYVPFGIRTVCLPEQKGCHVSQNDDAW
jgi:hypothetical protein